MRFEDRFNAEWISASDIAVSKSGKTLDMLEHELADINESLAIIDEKRRVLANLSKLYT